MSIKQVIDSGQDETIFKLIYDELVLIDIHFKDISNHVTFDTSEAYSTIYQKMPDNATAHLAYELPNLSIATQLSTPQVVAQRVLKNILERSAFYVCLFLGLQWLKL